MKKGQQWFQKLMQCLIIITGFYIIYRGSGILAETGWLGQILSSDKTAQVMREVAADTYLPGYTAALNREAESDSLHRWLEKIFPVLERWYQQMQEGENREPDQLQEEGGNLESDQLQENGKTPEETKSGKENGRNRAAEDETAESGGSGKKDEIPEEAETKKDAVGEEGGESEGSQADGIKKEAMESGEESGGETENDEAAREASVVPMEELRDFNYLLNHYFVVDPDTVVDPMQLDAETLLSRNLSIEKNPQVPQILIYHTHSQETFLDSVEGDSSTSIIGIGDCLAAILEEKYGYQVIHDTGVYDLVDGVLDRSAAYDYARASVQEILAEHPTIEVLIDLHRDGVDGYHFVTETNGKSTAQIMFFNGLSQNSFGESIDYLYNPYIEDNLAFSFQLQLAAKRDYPGFTRNIYLKGQRFNLHLRPRSLLIEAGTQLNTVEEEKNAMEPLADILNQVLTGET